MDDSDSIKIPTNAIGQMCQTRYSYNYDLNEEIINKNI